MVAMRFDLSSEPWIPTHAGAGGSRPDFVSLREALTDAHQWTGIAAETPLIEVGLYRLLIALLHRALGGPASRAEWAALRRDGRFPRGDIGTYLARWQGRFDLFSATHPFFQTPGLPPDKAGPVSRLQWQAENNPVIWDHASPVRPSALSPATAARLVVALHAFDLGGTKAGEKGPAFAKAAPLAKSAVFLAVGNTLFETLLLNLVRYDGRAGRPYEFDPTQDRPAWERDRPYGETDRAPDGPCDWLTWQSRRLLLIPPSDGLVHRCIIMPGDRPSASWDPRDHEPMVAYRRSMRAKGRASPWEPVGFRLERALWRDSTALLRTDPANRARPRTADWLSELAHEGDLDATRPIRWDAYGLESEQAKPLFWRHERFALPLLLGDTPEVVAVIEEEIRMADVGERLLGHGHIEVEPGAPRWPSPLLLAAQSLTTLPAKESDRPLDKVLALHFAPLREYWPRLEVPFERLLSELTVAVSGDTLRQQSMATAVGRWRASLRDAAMGALTAALDGLGESPRARKACARAQDLAHRLLPILIPELPVGTQPVTSKAET